MNELFAGEFGQEFQPLHSSGDFPDPVFGSPAELLVTDKSSFSGTDVHWRRAEAQHIAKRVKELVENGDAEPGEIVLLFAAGTDAEWYEEELRKAGLRTYRSTGRGYFGQQQVVDLLAYLRLLHNRYDDEALLTVLASPLVGVSNDALVLIRRAASRRPIFAGLEKSLPPALAERDARLLRAFHQRFDRLAELSTKLSLGAALRADRLGARLRPRRARPLGRSPPLREPAQARAPRALVRGAARRGRRGLRPLRLRAGGRRRARARGGCRGGRRRRGAVADDPRGEGARVQGRRGRGRGTRSPASRTRRDPRPLGRSLRLQGRASVDRRAPRRERLRRGARVEQARGGGRASAPLLRRDDARGRPADRLRRDRPGAAERAHDADRLGARPARRPRRARERRPRSRRARARRRTAARARRPSP